MFIFWYFYSSKDQICQTLTKMISENGRLTSRVNNMEKMFRLNSVSWQGCWKCRVSESNFYRAIHSAVACRVYVTKQHENFLFEKFMLHRYVSQRCIFVCAIDEISIQERNSPLSGAVPPLTFIAPSELHSHFLQGSRPTFISRRSIDSRIKRTKLWFICLMTLDNSFRVEFHDGQCYEIIPTKPKMK